MTAWQNGGARLDKKKRDLSPKTVKSFRLTLSIALNWAVQQDYIAANPAHKVKPPKAVDKEVAILDRDQARQLIAAIEGTELYFPSLLALGCGLRRSEALGLTWGDIGLERGRLTARRAATMLGKQVRIKEPKSATSARTLVIPAFVLSPLKRLRVAQKEAALAQGAKVAPTEPVCVRSDGRAWRPSDLSREWARLLKRRGLPSANFHALRHTFATFMLQAGIDLKHTSVALGHAGVGITGRIYAHVTEAVREDAAVRLDNLLARTGEVAEAAPKLPDSGPSGKAKETKHGNSPSNRDL